MPISPYANWPTTAIDTVTRTPITLAVDCRSVLLRNDDTDNDVLIYDQNTGGNEKRLPAGGEYEFPQLSFYRSGDTICWATAVAGTGPLRVEHRQ